MSDQKKPQKPRRQRKRLNARPLPPPAPPYELPTEDEDDTLDADEAQCLCSSIHSENKTNVTNNA